MKRIVAWIAVLLTVAWLGACTSVSNVLITPHPNSLRTDAKETLELVSFPSGGGSDPRCELPTAGAELAIGIAVTALVKMLEAEAKQYKATYSAGASAPDLWNVECLVFTRRQKEEGGREYLKLVAWLDPVFDPDDYTKDARGQAVAPPRAQAIAFRLSPAVLVVRGVKGKVAGLSRPWQYGHLSRWETTRSYLGWILPWMWIHTIWGEIDPEIYAEDLALKISLHGVAMDNGQRKLLPVGDVTLPFGKVSVNDMDHPEGIRRASGNMPALEPGADGAVPVNASVTVTEANDLGDVIGEAAGQVKGQQSSIVSTIQGWFGW